MYRNFDDRITPKFVLFCFFVLPWLIVIPTYLIIQIKFKRKEILEKETLAPGKGDDNEVQKEENVEKVPESKLARGIS